MSPKSKANLDVLQKELGVFFVDKTLLEEAVTHRSFAHRDLHKHNERLEFFGDSVLKLIVSEHLYFTYPNYDEGELSKVRSRIISDKFLAELALEIHLGNYIQMSYGEEKSGGRTRKSILSNALEALLGACYLDQGVDCAKAVFFRLWDSVNHRLDIMDCDDFKTTLQERCQKNKTALPKYKIVNEVGPDHKKLFHVEASVFLDDAVFISQGDAVTKKAAEQSAAKKIIDIMDHYIPQ